MESDAQRTRELRDHLESSLLIALPGSQVNGHREKRLPQTLSISLPGVESDRMIASMNDLAISAGAACTSASREVSHVLHALGLSEEAARAAMRLSLGRFTTREEIDWTIDRLIRSVQQQKAPEDETCKM
jgi:cysteine desulfurase